MAASNQISGISKSSRSTIIVAAVLLALSVFVFSGCGSILGIFRSSKNNGAIKSSQRATSKKDGDRSEESSYQAKLTKLLQDPSFVYVSANAPDKAAVAKIKSENDTNLDPVSLESKADLIAMDPEGTKAYITCTEDNKILVVDLMSNKVIKTIETKDDPLAIASNPKGKQAYITHHKSNYISVLDTEKNEITGTITVKDHPASIAVSFDGSKAFVGHSEDTQYQGDNRTQPEANVAGSNEIVVIDLKTKKLVASIPTRGSSFGIAVNSDGSQVFATTYEPFVGTYKDFQALSSWSKSHWNGVTVIDTVKNRVASEVEIPENITPHSIALTPDDKKAYIIGSGSDEARAMDTAKLTITAKIPLDLGG